MQGNEIKQSIFVITGMHRSGTSLIASLLQSAGVDIGKRLVGANESNAKGHFEDLEFCEFHQNVLRSQGISVDGWTLESSIQVQVQYLHKAKSIIKTKSLKPLWGWKDPRTTLFLDFWSQLIPNAKFIFVYRSPWDVIDSLYRRGDIVFHTNPTLALQLWISYNKKVIKFFDVFPERSLILNIATINNTLNCLTEKITRKFDIYLATDELTIYEESLLHREEFTFQRATLIKHFFPEAFELYYELEKRANLIDCSSLSSVDDSAQFPPYAEWALQDWLDIRRIEIELKRLQSQIQHMENSKFWKLRKVLARLKRALTLKAGA